MPDRRYSPEEVDAILGRALRAQHEEKGMSHEELVAAAKEVGVAAEQIDRAAKDVLAGREIERRVDEHMRRRWRGFAWHVGPYVLVMAFLVFVNLMTTAYPWVLWPAAAWGLGLAMHLMALLMGDKDAIARKVRKRERQRVRIAHEVRVEAYDQRHEDDDLDADLGTRGLRRNDQR